MITKQTAKQIAELNQILEYIEHKKSNSICLSTLSIPFTYENVITAIEKAVKDELIAINGLALVELRSEIANPNTQTRQEYIIEDKELPCNDLLHNIPIAKQEVKTQFLDEIKDDYEPKEKPRRTNKKIISNMLKQVLDINQKKYKDMPVSEAAKRMGMSSKEVINLGRKYHIFTVTEAQGVKGTKTANDNNYVSAPKTGGGNCWITHEGLKELKRLKHKDERTARASRTKDSDDD